MKRKIQYILSHPNGGIATVAFECGKHTEEEVVLEQFSPENLRGSLKFETDKLLSQGFRLSNWHVVTTPYPDGVLLWAPVTE